MDDEDKSKKQPKTNTFLSKIENGNLVANSNNQFEELIGKKVKLKGLHDIFKDETVSHIKRRNLSSQISLTPKVDDKYIKNDRDSSISKKNLIETKEINVKNKKLLYENHQETYSNQPNNINKGQNDLERSLCSQPNKNNDKTGYKNRNKSLTELYKNDPNIDRFGHMRISTISDMGNSKAGLEGTKSTKDAEIDKNNSIEMINNIKTDPEDNTIKNPNFIDKSEIFPTDEDKNKESDSEVIDSSEKYGSYRNNVRFGNQYEEHTKKSTFHKKNISIKDEREVNSSMDKKPPNRFNDENPNQNKRFKKALTEDPRIIQYTKNRYSEDVNSQDVDKNNIAKMEVSSIDKQEKANLNDEFKQSFDCSQKFANSDFLKSPRDCINRTTDENTGLKSILTKKKKPNTYVKSKLSGEINSQYYRNMSQNSNNLCYSPDIYSRRGIYTERDIGKRTERVVKFHENPIIIQVDSYKVYNLEMRQKTVTLCCNCTVF